MKYDVLDALREYLNQAYSKNTADLYYFAVKRLFADLDFNAAADISREEIERRITAMPNKNGLRSTRRGLIALRECFPRLELPDDTFYSDISEKKRYRRKKKFEPLQLDSVKRKINAIRDKRLKVAYRLMLATGIRVSEAASLQPGDVTFQDDYIHVRIKNGKGGKERTVRSLPDPYLARELSGLIASNDPAEPIFYSDDHMQHVSGDLGFECHDLRRVFSQDYQAQCKSIAPDTDMVAGLVMEAMGHEDYRTTKRYLSRKVIR
jgi:integrase/recombinase XerD